jgi:formylglycine-generating enzyme required for sulfatase activity
VKGDLNCDHIVNVSDIPYFLGSLVGQYTGCQLGLADMTCDGTVDGLDIAPFVACLVASIYPSCTQPPAGMVLVPAGEFQMGDTFTEGSSNELPLHAVYVDAFCMDTYEVTNQQYADGLNWAYAQGGLITVTSGVVYKYNTGTSYPYCSTTSAPTGWPHWGECSRITWDGMTFGVTAGKANHPMVMVSWYGSVAYANWRSGMHGKPLCYNLSDWTCNFGSGYRLPTEAEWEKAARGGVSWLRFPWLGGYSIQHARCNYVSWWLDGIPLYNYDTSPTEQSHPCWGSGSSPHTSPVGFFDGSMRYKADWNWPGTPDSYQTANGANGYGLHDMAGNAYEWCNDWYADTSYSSSPYDNPHGPASGTYRVLRGGGWYDDADYCRCAHRGDSGPAYRYHNSGFRLALDFP